MYFTPLFIPLSFYVQFQYCLAQFHPGNVPLAARSIYFNSRLDTSDLTKTAQNWPTLNPPDFTSLGWAGFVKVDNATYRWLGASLSYQSNIVNTPPVDSVVVTPTSTFMSITISQKVKLSITFLSPFSTNDFVRWSIPFSYVKVEVSSLDGKSHEVQIYCDVSGEWLSGDRSQNMTRKVVQTSPNIILTATLQSPQIYTDINGQADWGTLYLATPATPNATYKADSDGNCRDMFQATGKLDNMVVNTDPLPINFHFAFPLLALSHDLGMISDSSNSTALFAIGFLRSPAASLIGPSGENSSHALFYETFYQDPVKLVNDFLANYSQTAVSASQVDVSLSNSANSADPSGNLQELVSLAIRHVVANTELTVAINSDGSWNMSDAMLFMRSDGRTQPVELLYASFPMFMTLNPLLGKLLLEPLLRLQNSSPFTYAAPDLGNTYPSVNLATTTHRSGVEHTGNMLIMAYAQALYSGDTALIETYYPLFKAWADYLVDNSMLLQDQVTADSATTDESNLAIKGITGIYAFSAMSSALQRLDEAKNYSAAASNTYNEWKRKALDKSSKTILLSLDGTQAGHSTGYNLFADKWLNFSIVEREIYDAQTTLVSSLLGAGNLLGIPVDDAVGNNVTASWNMFVAALVNDKSVQNTLIGRLRDLVDGHLDPPGVPWPLVYDASSGESISGQLSSGHGALFAPMALTLPALLSVTPIPFLPPPPPPPSKPDARAIVGGVVGGLTVLSATFFFIHRRRRMARSLRAQRPVREDSAGVPIATGYVSAAPRFERPVPNIYVEPFIVPGGWPSGNRPLSTKGLVNVRHAQHAAPSQNSSTPNTESSTYRSGRRSTASRDRGVAETVGLRAEISVLRRELAEIRAAGIELPPNYESRTGSVVADRNVETS